MAKINLLPWRASRRKQRQREFLSMVGGAALFGVVLTVGLIWHFGNLVDDQTGRNRYLDDQIKELDKQIVEIEDLERKRAQLIARKQVIEQLQANRSQMVHLLDELVRTIPDGVRLTGIKQAGQTLTLEGAAQSNGHVSSYMRQIEASPYMKNPDLNVIEASGGDATTPYTFTLRFTITQPGAPEGEDEEADSAAGGK